MELLSSIAKCDLIPLTIRKRRMKWLEHVLRMKPSDIPNAVLEFERGENCKRAPGGKRKSWRTIVRDDLKKQVKPPKLSWKNWEKQWFNLTKEVAGNRSQWRALVRHEYGGLRTALS